MVSRLTLCRVAIPATRTSFAELGCLAGSGVRRWGAGEIHGRALAAKPVVFASEPEGTESLLEQHCRLGGSSRKFWTDGYLAAFARAGSLGLVTFDRDFERFPALELARLEPDL